MKTYNYLNDPDPITDKYGDWLCLAAAIACIVLICLFVIYFFI